MHLGCFQCFLPLFHSSQILGTLQAFSPVFRLIKGIRTVCVCAREREGGCLLVYLLPSHSKDFGMKHCKSTAPPFPDPCIFGPNSPPPSLSTQFAFQTWSSKLDVWPHPVHTNAAMYRSISLALFALRRHWLFNWDAKYKKASMTRINQ